MRKLVLAILISVVYLTLNTETCTPVDYVNPLVGTFSKHSLSNGNTYPAIALPWGMNFWIPQTGNMGDGWAYTYDIREMQIVNMGNYAHGNQPIQHMIYLYNYSGEPWKAQYRTREVMDKLYSPTPDGYCGDEDNGQTSAWYVFSAVGFYPVCPGSNQYIIGSPLFKKATLNLENGNKITIEASNNANSRRYINSMALNNALSTKNYLKHEDLMPGAKIQYVMSETPNKQRGINEEDFPYSFSNEIIKTKKKK